jgi:hypothetical protein
MFLHDPWFLEGLNLDKQSLDHEITLIFFLVLQYLSYLLETVVTHMTLTLNYFEALQ